MDQNGSTRDKSGHFSAPAPSIGLASVDNGGTRLIPGRILRKRCNGLFLPLFVYLPLARTRVKKGEENGGNATHPKNCNQLATTCLHNAPPLVRVMRRAISAAQGSFSKKMRLDLGFGHACNACPIHGGPLPEKCQGSFIKYTASTPTFSGLSNTLSETHTQPKT